MSIKDLFKMIESANKLQQLMNEDEKKIEISIDGNYSTSFTDFKTFNKYIKNEYIQQCYEPIMTVELVQDKRYKNYFEALTYWFDDLRDANNEIKIEITII